MNVGTCTRASDAMRSSSRRIPSKLAVGVDDRQRRRRSSRRARRPRARPSRRDASVDTGRRHHVTHQRVEPGIQFLPGIASGAQRVQRRGQRADEVGCDERRRRSRPGRGPAVHVGAGRGGGRTASRPAASSPAMIPVRTSPVPAVASAGVSVRFTTACPSGAATTVPGPFSNTIAPSRAARSRAADDAVGADRRVRPGARTRPRAA